MSIKRIMWGLRVTIFRMVVLVIVISAIDHFMQAPPPHVETSRAASPKLTPPNNVNGVVGHKSTANVAEQAVIVSSRYSGQTLDDLYKVEDKLKQAIESAGKGEFDGDEIGTDGSQVTLYMYGPDADAIFVVIKPILTSSTCLVKPVVTVRYGAPDPGIPKRVIEL